MKTILISLCLCASAVVFLPGCEPTTVAPAPLQATLPAIAPADLIARYNQRIELIDQVSAPAATTVQWTDDKGDKHFEQGEGMLQWRRPDELSFTIGKLGDTKFHLGCNPKTWWLFDLSSDHPVAYRGDMNVPLSPQSRKALPIPVPPGQLIGLLGITPLDASQHPTLATDNDQYQLTFPAQAGASDLRRRVWIDSHFRATRIALLDAHDHAIIESKLDRFAPLNLKNHPPGAYPDIATAIELTLADAATTVTLRLDSPTDGKIYNIIKDAKFNFDILARYYKVEELRPINSAAPTAP